MFCSKCGEKFSDDARFCSVCGEPSSSVKVENDQSIPNQEDTDNLHKNIKKPKKKTGLIIGIVAVIVIILIITVLVIGKITGSIIKAVKEEGEINFTTANIAEAHMASEIDEATSKPITKEDNFDEGTNIVYLTAKFKNAPTGTKVSAVWSYLLTGESVDTGEYDLEKSTQWIYFYLENPNGLSPGKYEVDIYINGEVKETLEFSIQGDLDYQAEETFEPDASLLPELTDAAIATKIDEITGEPLNEGMYLTTDDSIVYATVFIENAPVGTEVQAIWTHVTSGEILEGDFLYTEEPSSWVYYYLESESGLTLGDYKVDFFINGEKVFNMDFVVEE